MKKLLLIAIIFIGCNITRPSSQQIKLSKSLNKEKEYTDSLSFNQWLHRVDSIISTIKRDTLWQ